MKKLYIFLLTFILLVVMVTPASADTWVNGYSRSNGTYVNGYWRSDPDVNYFNNYSYKYNYNPYTGTQGTKSYSPLYKSYSSYYDYSSPSYSSYNSYSSSYTSSYGSSYSSYFD